MKPSTTIRLLMAAASLVLLVPELTVAQSTQAAQSNGNASPTARAEASDMVPAQAAIDRTLDADKAKPGDQFRARLANKVHLKNGTELPAGTQLEGQVATDDMNQNGTSKLALCVDKAQLKDGRVIPIKATIVGVYGPGAGPATTYPVAPGDQMANDWDHRVHQVDEINALSGVDLHSRLTSRNSGILVSTKKDDIKLRTGTELALAIGAAGSGQQSWNGSSASSK